MFFYIQGPNQHDLMPLDKIFDRHEIKKTAAIEPGKAIETNGEINAEQRYQTAQEHHQSFSAGNVYQAIDKLPEDGPALYAYQIMTSPVVTLSSSMTGDQALALFQTKRFRHLPVVSADGKVAGMVSDRDLLQYMAGLQKTYQRNLAPHKTSDKVELLMHSPVLTASKETDLRYIARLFVERRVDAMPIVTDGELKGMITRSDILHAVMSHYEFELWI